MNRVLLPLIAGAAFGLVAGEAPATKPPAKSDPAKTEKADDSRAPYSRSDYAGWTFTRPVSRRDIYYDLQKVLEEEIKNRARDDSGTKGTRGTGSSVKGDSIPELLAWAQAQRQLVERHQYERRWAEARTAADTAVKMLEKHKDDAAHPELGDYYRFFAAARQTAEDALNLEEARAAFDKLDLRVLGILWSESGTRMAIIANRPRALKVQERVDDACYINAIDTDRVDFRFVFAKNGKHYEFARYVNDPLRTAGPGKRR